MDSIEKTVIDILKKYTLNPSVWDQYNASFNLTKDLKINSARVVDIILDIEDAYDISISNAEIEQTRSVGQMIALIEKKTS